MSKREYDMMQIIKKHNVATAQGLDALLGTATDLLSDNASMPTDRIADFCKARGFTVGKAFAMLVNRGLDAFEADKPEL